MSADNLAVLRAEHEHLSTRMNRMALISFALMLLLVVSLQTGFNRIVESPQYRKLMGPGADGGNEAQVVLEIFFPWVSEEYFPINRSVSSGDRDLQHLRASATKIFTREIDVLGATVEIDVRLALVLLPLVLWASSIYLIAVWFKREAVQRLGEHALQSAADATDVDRLFFHERNSVYSEHPGRFAWWCYVAAMAALAAALARMIAPVLRKTDILTMLWLASPFAICTAYALMYAFALGAAIDDEARGLRGLSPRGRILTRMRDLLSGAVDAAARRIERAPRIFGISASTLVLLSLVTPFGTTCGNETVEPVSGYKILNTGADLKDKIPVVWLTSAFSRVSHWFGVTAYAVSLLLAIVTLVAVVFLWRRRPFRVMQKVAVRWIAFAIVLFALDLGLHFVGVWFLMLSHNVFHFLLPACVLLAAMGTILVRSHRQRLRELVGNTALMLSPIAVNAAAVAVMFICAGWWGLLFYVAGLLAVGLTWHAIGRFSTDA